MNFNRMKGLEEKKIKKEEKGGYYRIRLQRGVRRGGGRDGGCREIYKSTLVG